jgi:hypothetical protein
MNQHVEADIAFDAEAERRGIQLRTRTELNRVGRDREVGFARQPRIVAGRERNRDALQRWEILRRREPRIEPADRHHEVATSGQHARAQRHLAGEHELLRQARIDQHSVDRDRHAVHVEHTERVHLQAHQIVLLRGQQRLDDAEHDEPHALAELDHDRDVEIDERW